MKKFIKIVSLIVVVVTICLVCFVDCDKKTCSIPDGYYCLCNKGDNIYEFTENSIHETYGWEIRGDKAIEWVSSSVNYRAKIVERDGKIYFEGYKWRYLISSRESGSETIYEVLYNDLEKSITLVNKDGV